MQSLIAKPAVPSPEGHGWYLKDGELMMTQESGPKDLIELTICNCGTSKCGSKRCKCASLNPKCTPSCGCDTQIISCLNSYQDVNDTDEDLDMTLKNDTDSD